MKWVERRQEELNGGGMRGCSAWLETKHITNCPLIQILWIWLKGQPREGKQTPFHPTQKKKKKDLWIKGQSYWTNTYCYASLDLDVGIYYNSN